VWSGSFKERKAVGIEKVALPCWDLQLGMFGAAVDGAEEREELRPGAVAVVHGVRVALMVGAQAFEEPVHGVVPHVQRRGRHEPAVLGEK
jgi:hypothetical protein